MIRLITSLRSVVCFAQPTQFLNCDRECVIKDRAKLILFQVRQLAPEYYDNLAVHDSWVSMMYDFATNPKMSLRARMKRKYTTEDFHFYGIGQFETSHAFRSVASVSSISSSFVRNVF